MYFLTIRSLKNLRCKKCVTLQELHIYINTSLFCRKSNQKFLQYFCIYTYYQFIPKIFQIKKTNVKNLSGRRGYQKNKDSSRLTDWQECGGVAR